MSLDGWMTRQKGWEDASQKQKGDSMPSSDARMTALLHNIRSDAAETRNRVNTCYHILTTGAEHMEQDGDHEVSISPLQRFGRMEQAIKELYRLMAVKGDDEEIAPESILGRLIRLETSVARMREAERLRKQVAHWKRRCERLERAARKGKR